MDSRTKLMSLGLCSLFSLSSASLHVASVSYAVTVDLGLVVGKEGMHSSKPISVLFRILVEKTFLVSAY